MPPPLVTDGDVTVVSNTDFVDLGDNPPSNTTGEEHNTTYINIPANVTVPTRRRITKRLENTITASDRLVCLAEKKILMKGVYYTEKLQLLKAKVAVEERFATALEAIISSKKV